MIVEQGQAATSNISERSSFSIKANAKAFKLLSSNLYSDKPLAIVREIGCNALDSHVAAGCPEKPFHIVLPSDMHPWFEVTDFGTGLDDEQVRNVFTTYFESTKTTSNDFIGAMGLGSKSPFAYTDAYEIHARKDGLQRSYTCFLNQDGAPELFLLETREKDETGNAYINGVTIKVPVKAPDYHLFRQAARKAYKFFEVRPIVGANTKDWQWDEPDFGFEGTNFKAIKNDRTTYALMGPVAYPIDLNQLGTCAAVQFIAHYTRQTNEGFLISYPIGQLDVNAGREGLSYDKNTIKNLLAGIQHFQQEMSKEIQTAIDACDKKFDAIKVAVKNDPAGVFKFNFKGKQLTRYLDYKFVKPDTGTNAFELKGMRYSYSSSLQTKRTNVSISPSNDPIFILVDERKLHMKKIKYATENLSNATFIFGLDKQEGKQQFEKWIERFDEDGMPWKYMSEVQYTFPVVEKGEKVAKPREKVSYTGFYKFDRPFYSSIAVKDLKTLDGTDMEKDMVYLFWDTVARRLTINGKEVSPNDMGGVVWQFIIDGAAKLNREIVIVTPKVAEKIPKNWIDATELLKDAIELNQTKKTFQQIHGYWLSGILYLEQSQLDEIANHPKIDPVFKKLVERISKIQFGGQLNTTTEQFFATVFNKREDNSPDQRLIDLSKYLFAPDLMELLTRRIYSAWDAKNFIDSLVLFSAMMNHGIFDRTKIEELAK